MTEQIEFSKVTLRKEISSRGGGIEIDLSTLGFKGQKMAAFQNYLGGGLLGRVGVNDTLGININIKLTEEERKNLSDIGEQLKQHFFNLTNPDTEHEGQSYEQNQIMPISAY